MSLPQFHLCELSNDKLTIPPQVRTQYMSDPIRAVEWRKVLGEFDRKWSAIEGVNGASGAAATDGEDVDTSDLWGTSFTSEPSTKQDLDDKYKNLRTFSIIPLRTDS